MSYEINKRIAHYRKLMGKTQAEVAELLDMNLSTYSQCERKGNISAERVKKIAEALNISAVTLITGKEPERKTNESEFVLTNKEIKLINLYRSFSEEQKQSVLDKVQEYYSKKNRR